ncbi:hypothetical protein ACRAWF_07805 [Streptomyces sp. L7]
MIHNGQKIVLCTAFSPQKNWLAVGAGSQALIWDYKSGYLVHEFDRPAPVTEIRFSSKGDFLATIDDLYIAIFNLSSWRLQLKIGTDWRSPCGFLPRWGWWLTVEHKVHILKTVPE